MKIGRPIYYAVLLSLSLNTCMTYAQIQSTTEHQPIVLSKFNSYGDINYTFERNQFKIQLDQQATEDQFKSLKFTTLFDNETNPAFLDQQNKDLYFAWKLTNYLSVSLNVFENPIAVTDTPNDLIGNYSINNKSNFNKSVTPIDYHNINRNVSGYKFGVSSELGIGNNYKLGLNLDIGQIDHADLIGFNQREVNTTSFALGIRKSQFGASINTDLFLEDMEANLEQSRLGFELDWHFSEDGKLSFGSKKTMGDSSLNTVNTLDDITGNVQYIKFQHNL